MLRIAACRLQRSGIFLLVLAFAAGFWEGAAAHAQSEAVNPQDLLPEEDPFGPADPLLGDPFAPDALLAPPAEPPAAETPAPDATVAPEVEETAAVIQDENLLAELRRLAGGTTRQYAFAMREVIRQRAWTDLNALLAARPIDALDPADRVLVAETVGPLFLARAAAAPETSGAARAGLDLLGEALVEAATTTETIDQAIENLGAADRSTQLSATRTLLRGGQQAISRLAVAASRLDPPAPLGRLLEVLRGFDEEGTEALRQLALYGSEDLRVGAVRSLLALDERGALPILAVSLHAAESTATQRRFASDALHSVLRALPSRGEVETLLVRMMHEADEEYAYARPDTTPVMVWQINEGRDGVATALTTSPAAAARRVAEIAELMRRLGDVAPVTIPDALAADLRYRLLANPAFGTAAEAQAVRTLWGDSATDPRVLLVALERALRPVPESEDPFQSDSAMAVAVLRMIAAVGDSRYLHLGDGLDSPLMRALDHPLPRIRYEAAVTVGAIDPRQEFPGSAEVLERWVEMSRLGNEPLALMLVNQVDWSTRINRVLALRGYRVVPVGSVAELVRMVDEGGDLQLVVATSQPPDFPALEMVDRVRRRPLGAAVPIVLVGPETGGTAALGERWRAPAVLATPVVDEEDPFALRAAATAVERALRTQLVSLRWPEPLPPLSPAERQLYVREGRRYLARLASDPIYAEVYNARQSSETLVDAVSRAGFSDAGLRLLSSLGTPEAQDLLATVAMNPSLDLEMRRKAADALAHSVEVVGIQVPQPRIAEAYRRLAEATESDTVQVLERILGAMEQRAGVLVPSDTDVPREPDPDPSPAPMPQ